VAWLSVQIVVEILLAAALGAVVGWFLHTLYGKQQAAKPAKADAKAKAKAGAEPDAHARVAELETQLGRSIAEVDDLRRKSGIARQGERAEAAPEGSLTWRNRHLESRVRFLEGKLADFETEGGVSAPREDHNDEATRLLWRNRYLEGRIKYLEEELLRTGGLHAATVAPATAQPAPQAPKAPEGEKPELLDQPRNGRGDDLKLISGIGPKVEQKLNSIGVWHYAQISAWSQRHIDWVNAAISFAGRIERENWVTQATQLLERQSQGDLEEETNNA
jgi:predicted flap endonuclease-1-like 5' DNA nuclease